MILATDFDGTLCRHGTISDADREAISRFRQAGHLFGVVTGRDFGMYHTLTVGYHLPVDYVIAMDGALAVDSAGEILFKRNMDGKNLPELVRFIGTVCRHPVGCAMGKTRCEFDINAPEGNEYCAPLAHAEEIAEFTMLNTRCSTDKEAAEAIEAMRARYGKWINPLQNGVCIDIPRCGIDKGVGIADYADFMHIPHDAIWTAGDNYNDLAMLTRFHGCAMENGVQAVKDVSRGVYPDIASIIADMLKTQN